jgi:hypothetical protein
MGFSGTFDPKAFFGHVDKIKDAYGAFFQGKDKAAINGLKNLMQQAVQADAGAVKALSDANVATAKSVTGANLAGVARVRQGQRTGS